MIRYLHKLSRYFRPLYLVRFISRRSRAMHAPPPVYLPCMRHALPFVVSSRYSRVRHHLALTPHRSQGEGALKALSREVRAFSHDTLLRAPLLAVFFIHIKERVVPPGEERGADFGVFLCARECGYNRVVYFFSLFFFVSSFCPVFRHSFAPMRVCCCALSCLHLSRIAQHPFLVCVHPIPSIPG